MTLLGEPPIWSYFKPKPKTASKPHPSKRQKHEHPGTESTKELEPEGKDPGRKRKKKATTVEQAIKLPKNKPPLQFPKTPKVSSLGKGKGRALQGFLPTPPTTIGGPSRTSKDTSPSPNSPSTFASPNATPNAKILPYFTASFRNDAFTSQSSIDDQLNLTFDHLLDDTHPVPSSQTQNDLSFGVTNHSARLNVSSKASNFPTLNIPSSDSIRTPDCGDDNDGLLIIPSSQSQLPLFIPGDPFGHPGPINKADTYKHGPETSIIECIPSSQSQEIELSLPQASQKINVSGFGLQQSDYRPNNKLHNTTNPHLKRTFSDEVFPVSIYDSFPSHLFQEEDQNDPPSNSIVPSSRKENDEESVTESETENSDNEQGNPPHKPPANSGVSRQDTPPLQEAAYDASQEDLSQGMDEDSQSFTDDPQILQQTPESQGSSFDSLPPDLREIFGNSDDSFPPDFPMSLR